MIKQAVVICMLIGTCFSAFCQRTDGKVALTTNVKVFDNSAAKRSFELSKGAVVYLAAQEGKAVRVNLECFVKDPKKLPATLYSDAAYAHPVGKLHAAKQLIPFRDRSFLFSGYVGLDQLNAKDFPEYTLWELISRKSVSEKTIKASLAKYRFKEGKFFGYNCLFLYENNLDDPSPNDRLRILFKNGKLVGAVHQFCVGDLKPEKKVIGNYYFWADPSLRETEVQGIVNYYAKFRKGLD